VAAGVCLNLRSDDYITSTHRGHGHTLAKGAAVPAMMAELFGRATGTCGGKGGSMHIADLRVGILGANGVVAGGLPIAIGAAKAIRLRGASSVVACFFGDGAVNRGPFLEALNWACIYRLPVLFVCEDNGFAAFTRPSVTTGGAGAAARAEAIGIPAESIDGNDVALVDNTIRELVAEIRGGHGPRFVHAKTYRLEGHTVADRTPYRSTDETDEARERDPLSRLVARLGALGIAAAAVTQIEQDARAEMQAAVAAARKAPWPEPQAAFDDVQDIGAPLWPA
jgi:pyruvate dehydrogenase E1 component alpha subunit